MAYVKQIKFAYIYVVKCNSTIVTALIVLRNSSMSTKIQAGVMRNLTLTAKPLWSHKWDHFFRASNKKISANFGPLSQPRANAQRSSGYNNVHSPLAWRFDELKRGVLIVSWNESTCVLCFHMTTTAMTGPWHVPGWNGASTHPAAACKGFAWSHQQCPLRRINLLENGCCNHRHQCGCILIHRR